MSRGYIGTLALMPGAAQSVTGSAPADAEVTERIREENATLYRVINTVSSSLDLDAVLTGIVDIATEATNCHACFVYFLEHERLVLRAASAPYAHLVGGIDFDLDEGLTG